jgi:hypothetical protein
MLSVKVRAVEAKDVGTPISPLATIPVLRFASGASLLAASHKKGPVSVN